MSATWLREVRDFNKFFTTASNFPSISNFKIFEIRTTGIRARLDDLTKKWTDWHLPFSEAIPQDKPILLAEASFLDSETRASMFEWIKYVPHDHPEDKAEEFLQSIANGYFGYNQNNATVTRQVLFDRPKPIEPAVVNVPSLISSNCNWVHVGFDKKSQQLLKKDREGVEAIATLDWLVKNMKPELDQLCDSDPAAKKIRFSTISIRKNQTNQSRSQKNEKKLRIPRKTRKDNHGSDADDSD